MRELFNKYQEHILNFANTKYGRMYLSLDKWFKVKNNLPIVKVTPDSVHFLKGIEKDRYIVEAVFHSKSQYLKKFRLGLQALDLGHNLIDKIHSPDIVMPHFLGLTNVSWLPLVEFATTDPINPDANPETTTVDGSVYHDYGAGNDNPWSTIRAAAGTGATPDNTGGTPNYFFAGATTNEWRRLDRGILLFDTSSIGAGATVSIAILSGYGYAPGVAGNKPDLCVYESNPASNTALASGDFDCLSDTALSNAIAWDDWTEGGYNDFTLNASGLALVDTSGVSKFGFRNKTWDGDNTSPTWSSNQQSYVRVYYADNGSNKPKLVVTYSIAAAGDEPFHGFYYH